MTKETPVHKARWALPDHREKLDQQAPREILVKLDLKVQKDPRVREVMLAHRVIPARKD